MITSWKRDYVRVLKISPDGRLNEMLNLYKKLKHAGSKDSWGGLCRTANSKRKAALASKVNYHITWYLEQRIPGIDDWYTRNIVREGRCLVFTMKGENYE